MIEILHTKKVNCFTAATSVFLKRREKNEAIGTKCLNFGSVKTWKFGEGANFEIGI